LIKKYNLSKEVSIDSRNKNLNIIKKKQAMSKEMLLLL
tara:strand:+ start:195 stop:308 length:114 start_codon:yes stop_codon:yes gene_type:complete